MNDNLNIKFMKKTLYLLLTLGSIFAIGQASAQFRSIPGIVTDSFKVRYPAAKSVRWADKVTDFRATFFVDTSRYIARYSSDGGWLGATKRIGKDAIPPVVKDGLSKSKYAGAEWEIRVVTMMYLPGNVVQYNIQVAKSDLVKKNLLFSSEGQLLKDNNTL